MDSKIRKGDSKTGFGLVSRFQNWCGCFLDFFVKLFLESPESVNDDGDDDDDGHPEDPFFCWLLPSLLLYPTFGGVTLADSASFALLRR